MMKAVQFIRFGGPEVLEIVDLPDPHPGPGQIRIVVHAAGISATDCKLRKGLLSFGAGLPQTTGRDVAGVVDEVGEGVTVVSVGDRVYGADDGAGAAELALLTYRAPIPVSLVSSTEPPSPWHSKQHSATAFTATPFTRLLK
jgi:NADPH:quinone reductase-like Zn-dependent oxidoreductase